MNPFKFNAARTILLMAAATVVFFPGWGKDPYPVNKNLDIRHYAFHLEVNDTSDVVTGRSEITFNLSGINRSFDLDLAGQTTNGMGMKIDEVGPSSLVGSFDHTGDRIRINLAEGATGIQTIFIRYHGIPADGFVIGKNKFGDRTFFGDNWPDRGHHWLACVDHPSDKATVEFHVTAPDRYQVVGTGALAEESNLTGNRKLTVWKETAPVAVKVMTIGISRFSVKYDPTTGGTQNSVWVFPQNRNEGFSDFAPSTRILEFFTNTIGPFSFSKLAHVQSKTRWGGLENAGNIFYFENSVTGKGTIEDLIAHESAHQWFGNSATESDWHHVWLSEGFATYFTHYYNEQTHGEPKRKSGMERDRAGILKSELLAKRPVVDTTITAIGDVLSIITYQKASFVLHMLRREVGDAAFMTGIRDYYARHRNGNALTPDFLGAMEKASGKNLSGFAAQWIYRPGAPEVTATWEYVPKSGEVAVRIRQTGAALFTFPLELSIDGGPVQTISVAGKETVVRFKTAKK
ncbi:MAG: M1 family metallopeptidase, partial [Bacteroidota bacterium]